MDDVTVSGEELVHLGRLALAGRSQDIHLMLRRLASRYRGRSPEFASALSELLQEAPTQSAPVRSETMAAVPVDLDSRLSLIRVEPSPHVEITPIWGPSVQSALNGMVQERRATDALHAAGLSPSRTALFSGPPGVGKTLSARWLAQQLNKPLLILDLSAVMSSFLGRTGTNLRHVMDYAKGVRGVLLLDELDAVAKRRDDAQEIGELKRLVTALLQEIDDWPDTGLLLGATNHPDLLDPAAWRRFDIHVSFPLPDQEQIARTIRTFAGHAGTDFPDEFVDALTIVFEGASFSDIEREVLRARRASVLSDRSVGTELIEVAMPLAANLDRAKKMVLADKLNAAGVSQRKISAITGLSRDTLRKHGIATDDV